MKIYFFTFCIFLILVVLSDAKGQGWRGIVPLHSTCDDAKSILHLTKCEPSTVELEEATIFVNVSGGPCTSDWNVRAGTILTLDVQPKKYLRLSDLAIDETKYSRREDLHVQNSVRLENPEEGISIDMFEDGRIRHIFYGPSSRDQHLRCRSRAESSNRDTGSLKVDQYGFIGFEEERHRLDEFATTLSGWDGARGYIIVYPGRTTTLRQAQARASRAQSYLRRKKGLRNQIVTIIGGGREEPGVELFITVKNGSPPVVSPVKT
jgi:hypothetical protein